MMVREGFTEEMDLAFKKHRPGDLAQWLRKSTKCFSREPRFNSQNPCGSS